MKDILQLIAFVLVVWGAILFGLYKARKDAEPFYICIIRIIVYIFLALTPILASLEFIYSNIPVVEITAKKIGNNEDGVIELAFSNNSKSFGANVNIKHLLVLYEENDNNFRVKRSEGLLKSNKIFLPPGSTNSTYIIETADSPVMKEIFSEIASLKQHQLALYILLNYDIPFIPFAKRTTKNVLLYKKCLLKFYTVCDIDKYAGLKKIKTEQIFTFLKKDNAGKDVERFWPELNKE